MVKIESITKIFDPGTTTEKLAIDNISLSLDAGEFVTIIGGNGAGKSTLLNCIAGVYELDAGRIEIGGADMTFWPEYKRSRHIGRVFQDPLQGTAFDMTIEENLAIAYAKGKPQGLRRGITKTDMQLFRERLTLLDLGLEDRMKQKVGTLSGGQRQALTLLMATMVEPQLLLLDEHTASLDPGMAKQVLFLTRELVEKQHLCTLMVTHNMKDALEYGSRTIMMHEGRIIMDIKGQDRQNMTVELLVKQFGSRSGMELDNDRLLLI